MISMLRPRFSISSTSQVLHSITFRSVLGLFTNRSRFRCIDMQPMESKNESYQMMKHADRSCLNSYTYISNLQKTMRIHILCCTQKEFICTFCFTCFYMKFWKKTSTIMNEELHLNKKKKNWTDKYKIKMRKLMI